MRPFRLIPSFTLLATLVFCTPLAVDAQIFDKIKEKVKEEAEERMDEKIEEGVEAGFDLAESTVVCVVTDAACIEGAEEAGQPVQVTSETGEPIAGGAAAAERPGEGAWANYDFVPGDRVLFAESFEDDAVGDFPRRIDLVRGNWDIIEWKGKRLLRNTGPRNSAVVIPLPETLPERFTIEFEAHLPHGNQRFLVGTSQPESRSLQTRYDWNYFTVDGRRSGVAWASSQAEGLVKVENRARELNEALVPVRIMADGEYVKVYVGETRVANAPNAKLPRTDQIFIQNVYNASQENPILIADLRIAAGGKDLYEKLESEGRVATRGIYFDTGSDRIRPESTPTLEEIGTALRDHPELRLAIEGHTDSVGDDASNQALSERRAQAVLRHLVDEYGIDEARLEAVGMGESAPVADNATPEGRQQNRRVELVKKDA